MWKGTPYKMTITVESFVVCHVFISLSQEKLSKKRRAATKKQNAVKEDLFSEKRKISNFVAPREDCYDL